MDNDNYIYDSLMINTTSGDIKWEYEPYTDSWKAKLTDVWSLHIGMFGDNPFENNLRIARNGRFVASDFIPAGQRDELLTRIEQVNRLEDEGAVKVLEKILANIDMDKQPEC